MKKRLLSVVVSTFFTGISALTAAEQDSLRLHRTYALDEVVVTGTRNETDVRHLSQTVSILNRNKIEQTMQPSLLPDVCDVLRNSCIYL